MTSETSLVLAAPERKRILRELLARPEPWTHEQRDIYVAMICAEFHKILQARPDEAIAEEMRLEVFADLLLEGVSEKKEKKFALDLAAVAVKDAKSLLPTRGQQERARRRTFREAVTAGDGAKAVTTGLVRRCIGCNGPFYPRNHRRIRADSAFCSDACRQAASRRRKQDPLRTKPVPNRNG